MKNRKGFTLIELMVVVLIVAILAAVAIPIMRGRIDAAKWSEGKSTMGTIATALRAYQAEKGEGVAKPNLLITDTAPNLGFTAADLTGTYFANTDFSISAYLNSVTTAGAPGVFTFTIQGENKGGSKPPASPTQVTLSNLGVWVETP